MPYKLFHFIFKFKMSSNGVKICKKQTTITHEMLPGILQQLRDMCGQSSKLNQMHTKYTHPKRNIKLIIEESAEKTEDNKYTLTTSSTLPEEKKDQNVLIQQSNITSVIGDAHDFAQSLGFDPSHTWIENGEYFVQDTINIKLFNVCNCNGEQIDPDNIVVSIEAVSQVTSNQTDNTCKRIAEIYRALFPDRLSYVPDYPL